MQDNDSTERENSLRGFWSLFVTQFQGAFNDNAFKTLVIFMVLRMTAYTTEDKDTLAPVIGAVFAVPFILFSMSGGYLSDRYSKRTVAIGTKIAEVFIIILATIGLCFKVLPLLIAAVFLLSTQSAFFGPTKYGLLPELLSEKRLSWGNGVLNLGTFVAIITGTILSGILSDAFDQDNQVWSGLVLFVFSLIGLAASLGISRVQPANPSKRYHWNFLPEFLRQLKKIREDRVLFLAVVGSTYFWFLAALLNLTILFYSKFVLHLGDTRIGFLLAALAIGIGLGSFVAGFLSGNKIEYGLIPLGAFGISTFSAWLYIPDLTFPMVAFLLAALGFSGGFYIVPVNALIQHRPDPPNKGSVLATNAVLSFIGVFLSSCVYYLLKLGMGMTYPQLFLVCSLMTLGGSVLILQLLPDALMRLLIWILTHSLYRLHVEGRNNIPGKGGALFVSNHLSVADAFFVIASTDRHIRFLICEGVYEKWWIKPFARMLRSIPISSDLHPREMVNSLQEASHWIKEGNVVCILAEGQIKQIGQTLPFHRIMQKIMKSVDVPILPVHLDNVWGSMFSSERGWFFWRAPHQIPYPVTVSYGQSMSRQTPPSNVQQAVQELGAEAREQRKSHVKPLNREAS